MYKLLRVLNSWYLKIISIFTSHILFPNRRINGRNKYCQTYMVSFTPSDVKWDLPILTSKHKSEYLWVISTKGIYLDIIFKTINRIKINCDNEKYYS